VWSNYGWWLVARAGGCLMLEAEPVLSFKGSALFQGVRVVENGLKGSELLKLRVRDARGRLNSMMHFVAGVIEFQRL
jgi:hypothetical protein